MHSFVVTQVKRRAYALYPLLSLIVLLVQKPILLVVFKRELFNQWVQARIRRTN